jgi:hypothetical protein
LNGAITPTTPTGTRSAKLSRGCSLGISSPYGRDGSVAASYSSLVTRWVSNWAAGSILPLSRMLHFSISAALASQISAAFRSTADRSECGRAAHDFCAVAACRAAAAVSAGPPIPVRPSSVPVAGSVTAASPPDAVTQPPE